MSNEHHIELLVDKIADDAMKCGSLIQSATSNCIVSAKKAENEVKKVVVSIEDKANLIGLNGLLLLGSDLEKIYLLLAEIRQKYSL